MARALRIEIPGGRHHITARGNERKDILWDDADRFHFLELLGEITQRFGEDDAGWQEVARYVHLNPVRLKRLGLGKAARTASHAGLPEPPAAELVAERLAEWRQFRWSSYRGYAGYAAPLAWVWLEPLARLCGGSTGAERQAALREYTEGALMQGGLEPPWQRVVGGVALGSETYAQQLRREARGNPREQRSLRSPTMAVSWERIISALERVKGEKRDAFAGRRGDWGRDAALWLGRRAGRMRLAQLGELAGGLDYANVSKAVTRFSRRLGDDPGLRQELTAIEQQLSNDKM